MKFQNGRKLMRLDALILVIGPKLIFQEMKINMFDYIYHEHFSYFSVKVLRDLLDKCGLELIHAGKHNIKGGSIRVIAQHKGAERKTEKSES